MSSSRNLLVQFNDAATEITLNPEKPEAKADEELRRLYVVELQLHKSATRLNNNIPLSAVKESFADLDVPDYFFDDHLTIGTRFRYSDEVRVPRLLSSINCRESFHLEYFEPRCFEPPGAISQENGNAKTATCRLTGRDILCHQWKRKEMLLTISRKCSFWCRRTGNSGWDAVLLCDPAPIFGDIDGEDYPLSPSSPFPYTCGFNIVTSRPNQPGGQIRGTNHASLFDDLHFCFKNHAAILKPYLVDPLSASLFARKILTAHFNHILAFVTHQTSSMRSRGWSLKRTTEAEVNASRQVEREWSQFRCSEFLESLADNLDALGIPVPTAAGDTSSAGTRTTTTGSGRDWSAVDRDLQHIYLRFEQRRQDYDRITGSVAALVGMKEAERSLNVAKMTTYFALVLTPFAWMAGFFSMDDRYLPDGDLRWVYWVVSLGIIVMSILLYRVGSAVKLKDVTVGRWMTRKGLARKGGAEGEEAGAFNGSALPSDVP